ncbi:hypothetical protein CCR96_12345 [Halochromatium roseum]|nr:hypothetical protein [Halochromatium roseum]
MPLYAAHRVPEVWLVDLQPRSGFQGLLNDPTYRLSFQRRGEHIVDTGSFKALELLVIVGVVGYFYINQRNNLQRLKEEREAKQTKDANEANATKATKATEATEANVTNADKTPPAND